MKIITDCEQGSPEWFSLRLASIGGSGISKATSSGRGNAESKTRTAYLYKKADEFMTGQFLEGYKSPDMILGNLSEPYSRDAYAWKYEIDVQQVAIIKASDFYHVSPDGLVGDDGCIEIKNTNGPNFIEHIYKDKVPPEHIKQIQWTLSKAEKEWCDFIHGCWLLNEKGEIVPRYPKIEIWVKRVYRDEKLIKELNEGAKKFINEMLMVVNKIKEIK